jgi:uncharacterized membrane protein
MKNNLTPWGVTALVVVINLIMYRTGGWDYINLLNVGFLILSMYAVYSAFTKKPTEKLISSPLNIFVLFLIIFCLWFIWSFVMFRLSGAY